MLRTATLVLIGIALSITSQDRFESGELKGFTKSSTEHIISRLDHPVTVLSVRGTIIFKSRDEPMKDVLFEIRGPGTAERIRASRTDTKGRFSISRVPEGQYCFKATERGYQSVVGTVIVSKKADRQTRIKIEMSPGV
jgi:hypothetical protein